MADTFIQRETSVGGISVVVYSVDGEHWDSDQRRLSALAHSATKAIERPKGLARPSRRFQMGNPREMTQQKGTEVPLVLLDDLTRPVPDLIAEMAEAAERFEQVAMILARTESDTVHFIWHHPDCRALVAEVEALVSDGCVPVGLLAIRETPEGWDVCQVVRRARLPAGD